MVLEKYFHRRAASDTPERKGWKTNGALPLHAVGTMSDSTDNPGPGKRRRLERLMELGLAAGEPLRPAELRALWRHQLGSPLQFDLGNFDPNAGARLRRLSDAEGLLLRSLGDLLRHPQPPLELLRLAKDFAKAHEQSPDGPLPPELARVLYYAAIAAAWARCGRRITALDDAQLRRAFDWALAQPWMDRATKELFATGRRLLP
jgi:hypothetical protein